jgi:acid phosphatase (class A)
VRPDKLDPTLTPLIDVPEHPAYPSGHSTQAHAVAFLLTALAPDQKAKFESDALRVAVNREIAGVHYPSDSAAGRLLARQIVDLMLRDRSFAALVESAKAEWPVNR